MELPPDKPFALAEISPDLHQSEQFCIAMFDSCAMDWLSMVRAGSEDVEEFVKAFDIYLEKDKKQRLIWHDAFAQKLPWDQRQAVLSRLTAKLDGRKWVWLFTARQPLLQRSDRANRPDLAPDKAVIEQRLETITHSDSKVTSTVITGSPELSKIERQEEGRPEREATIDAFRDRCFTAHHVRIFRQDVRRVTGYESNNALYYWRSTCLHASLLTRLFAFAQPKSQDRADFSHISVYPVIFHHIGVA